MKSIYKIMINGVTGGIYESENILDYIDYLFNDNNTEYIYLDKYILNTNNYINSYYFYKENNKIIYTKINNDSNDIIDENKKNNCVILIDKFGPKMNYVKLNEYIVKQKQDNKLNENIIIDGIIDDNIIIEYLIFIDNYNNIEVDTDKLNKYLEKLKNNKSNDKIYIMGKLRNNTLYNQIKKNNNIITETLNNEPLNNEIKKDNKLNEILKEYNLDIDKLNKLIDNNPTENLIYIKEQIKNENVNIKDLFNKLNYDEYKYLLVNKEEKKEEETKKIELVHKLNMLKIEKEKLNEKGNEYKYDLNLYETIFKNKNLDEIPELFKNKFLIFKILEEKNNINFDDYYELYYNNITKDEIKHNDNIINEIFNI
jgi:hypothetical protein